MFVKYRNGAEFIGENRALLRDFPMESIFFAENAQRMDDNADGFVVKVAEGDDFLLCLRYGSFPMSMFGSERLCGELAAGLVEHGLSFGRILAERGVAETFMAEYERRAGGSHAVNRELGLMRCRRLAENVVCEAETATPADADEVLRLIGRFAGECAVESRECRESVKREIDCFAVVREAGRIVSIAKKARETEYLCSVTGVYTLDEYRGRGLAARVVARLTREILESGKVPYLFVDAANDAANRLYLRLGYEYMEPRLEIKYTAGGEV